MTTKELLVDGNGKKVYSTEDPDLILIHFDDVATAFGGIKRARIKGKGICTNRISAMLFEALSGAGVDNHFVRIENEREQLCRKLEVMPLQIIVRNRLAGTTSKLLGVEAGTEIPNVVFEVRYNDRRLGCPMINDHHVVALGIATYAEMGHIYDLARRTNDVLIPLFHKAGIELVDFKLEFGRTASGDILIADEISPDNSRLWDEATGKVLDKDRFRHDMSDVTASYKEILDRLENICKS